MTNERIAHIDTLKAFGIFLVLIGHRTNSIFLEQYIYSFHIPLFFWISGYLFEPTKYVNLSNFISRRIRTLILPYFIFSVISFIFWYIIVRGFSVRGQALSIDPWYPLLGILYGIGVEPWRNPLDIALWFLPCLFLTEVIFWIIIKYTNIRYFFFTMIVLAILGYLISTWHTIRIPWSGDVAIMASVFYGFGYIFRKFHNCKLPLWRSIMIMVFLAIIGISASYINGKADMNYIIYGNLIFFISAAIANILFWFQIFEVLPDTRFFTYIGQNTIILLGFLGISAFIIRGINYILFSSFISVGKSGIFLTVSFSLLEIIILLPVIYLIDRYAPYVIGRRNKRSVVAVVE